MTREEVGAVMEAGAKAELKEFDYEALLDKIAKSHPEWAVLLFTVRPILSRIIPAVFELGFLGGFEHGFQACATQVKAQMGGGK